MPKCRVFLLGLNVHRNLLRILRDRGGVGGWERRVSVPVCMCSSQALRPVKASKTARTGGGEPVTAKQLVYFATCYLNRVCVCVCVRAFTRGWGKSGVRAGQINPKDNTMSKQNNSLEQLKQKDHPNHLVRESPAPPPCSRNV